MHLILTHERADFDAIASLLGAACLYPEGIPLVPRDVNQNARDFLTLYWDEFPFVEFANRPTGKISQITMVDSQYIPTIRGRSKRTRLRVIDHHTAGEHLPPHAEATLVETGATATCLVEQIARANIKITPLHATLMLLGIYEDCGSLTYQTTTPNDVRAAAWLLEQGARLDMVRDFLHHTLTPAQQRLYHAVVNKLESHTINGRQILIGAVQAEEHVAEISNLAHQLRDLYNPDGLLLLVGFTGPQNQYVQLIARSTTDAIHVGRIAEAFGGGGHPRAAAAHIGGGTLEAEYHKLMAALRQHVQPAATVRQIMSFRVRTVSPSNTIQQAADMMTRYGHEGYPVADGGKIVGILTRRQIDKALHHRLGSAPIRRYMHAGEIFVTPNDTVEHLQNIMLQERVGQVPVVENGQITGIVTRTDLINLWSQGVESAPQAVNLAEQLADSLPASLLNLLTEAGRVAAEIGSALYIVGGFVRDLLLQKPVFDVDLVVEGDAIALAQAMQARHGGRIRSHRRFGTANWIIEGAVKGIDRLDFVTARTEFYQHPTALPEVEQSSIKQDLHRRDFTINTLAIRLTPAGYGDLLDFYGGYRDLQEGLIRVLHSLSFVEDPTRILRAIRLEQRLGFYLGRRTMEHLQNARDLLKRVTPDRIFSELEYTFNEAKPEKAYRRFSELGVLQTIFPPLQAGDWFAARCVRLRNGRAGTPWETLTPTPAHYFGLLTFPLSAEESSRFVAQLRVRASLQKLLRQIQAVKEAAPTLAQTRRPSRIYTLLTPYQDEALLVCWLAFDDPALQTAFIEFSRTLRHVRPLIDGQYLIEEFGLRPAPLFSRILNRLRDARLDGQVDTLADEHALVAQILEESPPTA